MINFVVTQDQADALNFANAIIEQVRRAMPYGAGNLTLDVQRTGGESAIRTQHVLEAHMGQRNADNSQSFKPKLLAGIARRYGAGNCDMAGSMAYTLLRGKLDNTFEVMLILNEGHTYAGFKRRGDPDSASIIVDPWPTSGMATLAEHHFLGFSGNIRDIIRKAGKWDANIDPEARTQLPAKYHILASQMDADIRNIQSGIFPVPNGFTQYGNTLCSVVVGAYVDQWGNALPLPVERAMMPMPPAPTNVEIAMYDATNR